MDLPDIDEILNCHYSTFVQSANNGSPLNWNLFYEFVNDHLTGPYIPERVLKFCTYVLNTFLVFDCPDSFLVLGIIRLYEIVSVNDDFTNEVYRIIEDLRVPPCGSFPCTFERCWDSFISEVALLRADVLLIDVLLKYGFTYEGPGYFLGEPDVLREYLHKFYHTYLCHIPVEPIGEEEEVDMDEDDGFIYIMDPASQSVKWFLHSSTKEEIRRRRQQSFSRTLLVVKVVEAVSQKLLSEDCLPTYLQCLNMYFRAIPDPIVSSLEMEMFLGDAMRGFGKEGHDLCVELFLPAFHELFPDSPKKNEPRSLQHLCRCKVREQLKNSVLPVALQQFRFSESFTNYLMCKSE